VEDARSANVQVIDTARLQARTPEARLPHWQEWRLRDIGRQDVQQWVADRFRQGIGWQTVRNAWTLLSGILEAAVEYGYLSTNPARRVKFPLKELKEPPAVIAGAGFVSLLDQLREPYRTMISLVAATGLRVGELLALRWRALDLEGGTLTVRESVFEGKFQPPKTQKAKRTIPLGPRTIEALRAHGKRVSRTESNDLVFGNRDGHPFRSTSGSQRSCASGAHAPTSASTSTTC
jgi:integrase